MLWEVEIRPRGRDLDAERVSAELAASGPIGLACTGTARVYLLDGPDQQRQAERLANVLLTDSVVESCRLAAFPDSAAENQGVVLTVLLKPGVMDPAADSVQKALRDLAIHVRTVRTARRYFFANATTTQQQSAMKLLANEAIEQPVIGPLSESAYRAIGSTYAFNLVTVPIRDKNDEQLVKLSREGQLSLNLDEMRTIQSHFRGLQREPTDIELETIAQTWSEHCSHKTLKGRIEYTGPTGADGKPGTIVYQNLLKETVFGATQHIRRKLGVDDWCVSVFEDNAGVVKFDEQNHVCFKVETHNHPSAIEPYGGANTGLGGVIRDVLGTGLGGKPICNTDVFCFASPETPADQLPPGTLHPRRVMRGVVAGVRDYGNRMGIPTVNGAICFDDRYLGNPLVYCGTVGLIPVGMERKQPQSNDLIVAVGGRTGRDGIHGATFSSVELTHESEQVSGGAVQIGNAITEKKVLDVILQARDRRLYTAITDCGAGGFSSAVGEMGADLGAEVHLEKAPLKYDGLSYTEIWISEAQERMVLSVPPEHWPALRDLCAGEDVEAVVLGIYAPTGRLKLYYQDQLVGDLDMHFLHNGLPKVTKSATLPTSGEAPVSGSHKLDPRSALLAILSSLNVCSKEWVIRQYDHEVQGGSVVKPLVGVKNDGPSDAAVVAPVLGSARGVAIGCGINPALGDLDPYWMAASAIDEAMRNVVAVGADPSRVALLDNFCWGNTNRPEVLGSLVRSAEACHDVALAYTTPFISGKDSLNNEYHTGKEHIIIPPTLLISALGQVPNVTQAVTMDLKSAGNRILLVGNTRDERGGSHWNRVQGMTGGMVPKLNLTLAPKIFEAVHQAILQGVVRACHDPSEGGLAVALAEMAFSGGLGIHATLPEGDPNVLLFSESNTRFVLEVLPNSELVVERTFRDLPWLELGEVTSDDKVHIAAANGQPILVAELSELKSAWQRPLAW